ncbi:MAG: alpha-2-macroglobulin, partial [Chromatiaceae bacterium]|nr:alpha-2-macroglobulin [Chromatiaceae bacterium]
MSRTPSRPCLQLTSVPALLMVLALLASGPDPAQAGAADARQLLLVPNSDLAGRDYQVLKEVELDVCKVACLADPRCRAFTYNTKARWCFLKDRYEDPRTFVGAVSGRVLEGDAATLADQRRADLAFLPAETLSAAAALVQGIAALAAPDQLGLVELTTQARSARGQGDGERSVALFAAAVRLAPDDSALWLGLAQAALAAKPDPHQVREARRSQAVAAAVNAYLTAGGKEEQAGSLAVLGRTLAGRNQWRPAIAALSAALAIKDDQSLGAELRQLKEQHGFRVTGHRVELDSATPRICIELSEPLARTRPNLADFVRVEDGRGLEVEAEERQICIDGVSHGSRYPVQVRAGLPAANGDVLERSLDLDIKVGDRVPSVRFSGRAYVLPRGGESALPVVSVNADRIAAVLYRIGDRSIAQVLGDGRLLKQLDSYQAEQIADQSGERLWSGTIEVAARLNQEVTTAIPLSELIRAFEPGVYALTATPSRTLAAGAAQGCDGCSSAPATQWFVVSDLGLTALTGNDGLHALVRSLSGAAPLSEVRLRLIARNNEVLGSAVTDAAGYARFEPGLLRGTGGNAPLLLTAETEGGDYGFLDLAASPFDLSDRGVTGRPAPKPMDVFLVAERGAYRPGETVHFSALVRDARAEALAGIPLTLVVKRPDGVESERLLVQDAGLGGYQSDLTLTASAMRGTWRVQAFADPKGEPLAQASFLVEDFEPERLDFTLKTGAAALDPGAPATVVVDARFLYGAPGSRLSVEGETLVQAADSLADYPGYRFGLADDQPEVAREPLDPVTTDDQGRAQLSARLPELAPTSRPLRAQIQVRVADPGGRAVERTLEIPVLDGASRIGVRPLFDGQVEEGGSAGFEVLTLGPDGARRAASGLAWTLYRVDSQFQWYRGEDGTFDYEPVERTRRVASGHLDLKADRPGRIETPVQWGGYRLEIAGDGLLPVSLGFEAGWYLAPRAADTPDQLRLTLDKGTYRVGERARVHIEPRAAAGAGSATDTASNIALVMVLDNRLIAMRAVEVPPGGATLELPVTADWGPGAYVTAALYRPLDRAAKRIPGRALGLAWAEVDPGERRLQVALETAPVTRPRGPMQVRLQVPGLTPGEEAYATLAAVDLGILNLTGYKAPQPDAWYFGQRRLGIEFRDLYGQLIDPMQGAPGVVRSGGDGGLARLQAPPPTEELMAWFSGVVRLDDQGGAVLEVPVPSFNGTVRLMAMAWTARGVGHGTADALVRDPVVLTVGMPRFLAPGDRSRLLLDLTQVEGGGGPTRVAVSADQGLVALDPTRAAQGVTLTPGARTAVLIPMEARAVGDETLSVRIDTAEGQTLTRPLTLGVRDNTPPVYVTERHPLSPGGEPLTLTAERLADMVPGTGSLLVSVSRAGRLDLAGLLRTLDRYPHGCTEQLVSRALPLLYLDQVALAAGLAGDPAVKPRV